MAQSARLSVEFLGDVRPFRRVQIAIGAVKGEKVLVALFGNPRSDDNLFLGGCIGKRIGIVVGCEE